jgi:peroxiredoxin
MDPPAATREHLARTGWTFSFLSDPEGEVVRRYDLLHQVTGDQVVARPAELLIDPSGTVRWVDLTDDYRIRTRPETVLQVFDRLTGGARSSPAG